MRLLKVKAAVQANKGQEAETMIMGRFCKRKDLGYKRRVGTT
jgi:hypothetical protein